MSKKNSIDIELAKKILGDGYGLFAQEMNSYQFRIREEETMTFWDWYYTTGSLVENDYKFGVRSMGKIKDPEEVAIFVKKRIENLKLL